VEPSSGKTLGMIEYMPAETAWRGVQAEGYFVIHCLQVPKRHTGQGLGTLLLQECIEEAQSLHKNGVVALTTQRGWCADKRIYLKNGFEVVDQADPGLELVALRINHKFSPGFGDWKGRARALGPGIFFYNSKQCPFWRGERNLARQRWLKMQYNLDAKIIEVDNFESAKTNPCVWGTSGIVCNGKIINYVTGGDAFLKNELKRLNVIA
jgi:hypothetical protein